MKRIASPCVGICSTTYGDLVCRGCKRFAHEIRDWNRYRVDQRAAVVERLNELLDGAIGTVVRVADIGALRVALRISERESPAAHHLYRALQLGARNQSTLDDLGLVSVRPEDDGCELAADALRTIDREFYLRSRARYEHQFKVLSD